MKKFISNYLSSLWHHSASLNNKRLAALIEKAQQALILEMGCDEGSIAISRYKNKIAQPQIIGIDIEFEKLIKAKENNLNVVKADAKYQLPFQNNTFDLACANHIIEHLSDIDTFTKEIYRVLKPGGYVIIATENLSSWHNIFALLLGWQAFSQHISRKVNLGNPLRLGQYHHYQISGMHVKIFTLIGLKELLEIYDLRIEGFFGAGYYPFPPILSTLLSYIDPVHSAFIGIKARKEQ